MHKSKLRSKRFFVEMLESRQLLSGATVTSLAAPTATLLGQTVVVTVNVDDSAGGPVAGGTVNLLNAGVMLSSAATDAMGVATFTFNPGNALYIGNYAFTAQFAGDSNDLPSTSAASNLTISMPSFTTDEGDGVGIASVTPGSGTPVTAGDIVTAIYTGFFPATGATFDESSTKTRPTFTWEADPQLLSSSVRQPEQVVPGFDEGVTSIVPSGANEDDATGMEPGETRVIFVPAAQGYNDGMDRIWVIQVVQPGAATVGTPSAVSISSTPSSVLVGAVASPLLADVFDANGNLVTNNTSTITVGIASGPTGGTLGGATSIAAQAGQATFSDLTFSEPGTYTLTLSDGSLTSVTSQPIDVASAGLQLVFAPVNASYNVGWAPAPTVYVEDQNGNVDTTDNSFVAISLTPTDGSAPTYLAGVQAVNGVATLDPGNSASDPRIFTVGTYTLTATDVTAAAGSSTVLSVLPNPTAFNLSVVKGTLPSAVVAGATVRDYVTVDFSAPRSNGGTYGSIYTTDLYATATGTIDSSSVTIGTVTNTTIYLAAGRSRPIKIPITMLPTTLNGTYTLVARTMDNDSEVSTSGAGPTLTVGPAFTQIAATIEKLTLLPALVGGSKSNAVAVVHLTNTGNIAVTPSAVGLYASPDGAVDSTATLIAQITKVPSLAVGKTAVATIHISQIPNVTNGSYTIIAQATGPNGYVATEASPTLRTIAAPFVSLVLTPVSVSPTSLKVGAMCTFTATLTNNGNIATSGQAMLTIGFSSDGTTIATTLPAVNQPLVIKPGAAHPIHMRFKIAAGLAAGSYFPALMISQDSDAVTAISTTAIVVG